MNTKITPLGENVLIKPVEVATKTESGIFIPDSVSAEKPQQGTVEAVGDSEKIGVKKGQVVIYKKFGGEEIKVGDDEFVVVKLDEIIAVIG
ncbi:MAG: co-chaperone GroES [Candidatus Moranbacteria bacterium]|nr:co-chaperone GroES [Candidatus Moranbacteria bacterium]